MERTYIVSVRVTVRDEHPDDPDNEENVVYAAYGAAKDALDANSADWWAEEDLR